jgi:hypothetical protein
MSNGTGRNVYLIQQNVIRQYGEYLVSAVVLAPGPGRAVKALLRHVRLHHPRVTARRSRLTVSRIGENAPESLDLPGVENPGCEATVVAVVFDQDDDR